MYKDSVPSRHIIKDAACKGKRGSERKEESAKNRKKAGLRYALA